ncbi:glycoside hydrolase family 43 protein [Galbitalea soli]|uniref:Glycoside hydrolase family 43 protein n=2 Tax=Galbitalea soli TaxID=1268042 RepID=A0A7C9TR21_9MICO|nr:glycoside hydrolase family 43 protein [Galbitalea soli]
MIAGATASLATTPVVAGFHPDPTICRVGDDYYLANSSFEYFPGVPLRHSRDLVTWGLIGNALTTVESFPVTDVGSSQGVYAPTLRHHDGRFWLITTNVSSPQDGHLLISATDPAGPWSDVRHIPGLVGIDPDIAWDDAGNCFVTYCTTAPGTAGIAQARIDPERGERLEAPRPVWNGTGLAFPEAPHLYHVGGWWYLLIAEGGTERGHGVSVARSRNPEGPFMSHPSNPIFSHRSTSHAVQNTGHADLVEGPGGRWFAVYLGVRPRGVTPQFHVNGRETFLAAVDWIDGWPVFDETSLRGVPALNSFIDEFEEPVLHPRWVSPSAVPATFARSVPTGLALTAPPAPGDRLNLLAVRAMDHEWSFEAELELADGDARVVVRLDDQHWYSVDISRGTASALLQIGPLRQRVGSTVSLPTSGVTVSIKSVAAAQDGPDDVELGVALDGGEHRFGTFDGRYLSTEVAGGFTGRVVGVAATRGEIVLRRALYRTGALACDAHPSQSRRGDHDGESPEH